MTVKELIEQLQQLDPDLHVFVQGYEGGFDHAGPIGDIKEIALDVHTEWYYGRHEEAKSLNIYTEDKSKHTIVKGIIL